MLPYCHAGVQHGLQRGGAGEAPAGGGSAPDGDGPPPPADGRRRPPGHHAGRHLRRDIIPPIPPHAADGSRWRGYGAL
eukprot:4667168-Pyramimonas_sp.AAC.1